MLTFKGFIRRANAKEEAIEELSDVTIVPADAGSYQRLREGTWHKGSFDRSIRIDLPTHLAGDGQSHAHVFARNGTQLGVVNFDGTASHSSQFRLPKKDAKALVAKGFSVRDDRRVEWIVWPDPPELLLEATN